MVSILINVSIANKKNETFELGPKSSGVQNKLPRKGFVLAWRQTVIQNSKIYICTNEKRERGINSPATLKES